MTTETAYLSDSSDSSRSSRSSGNSLTSLISLTTDIPPTTDILPTTDIPPTTDKNIIYITEHERKKKRSPHTNISIPSDGKCIFKGCEYVCNSRKIQTYSMHILNKHSSEFKDEKIYKYKCSTCNTIFDKRADLMRHIKSSHQIKTYSCYICKNDFKTTTSLITHYMRKHTNYSTDADCVDHNNQCINCYKPLNKSGFMYHMATCIGIDKEIIKRSSILTDTIENKTPL